MINKKYRAFTLAEVLITLVIIGVVAAITVPVIVADHREKALTAALKKNYSILSNALALYYSDNGVKLAPLGEESKSPIVQPKLAPYLNIMNDCGVSKNTCLSDVNSNYRTYDNKQSANIGSKFDASQFILDDGTFIAIGEYPVKSTKLTESNIKKAYYAFFVDVNGTENKPNRLGEDAFMFVIDPAGNLVPAGAKVQDYNGIEGKDLIKDLKGNYYDTSKSCQNTKSGKGESYNGLGCTTLKLQK